METSPGRTHEPDSWSQKQILGTLAVAGAVVLVGSLFLDWARVPFGTDTPGVFDKFGISGWESLETGDALFVLIAIVVVLRIALGRLEGPWLLILGLGAAAVVFTFLVSTVPIAEYTAKFADEDGVEPGRGVGAWIAVGGVALLLIPGAILAKAWNEQSR